MREILSLLVGKLLSEAEGAFGVYYNALPPGATTAELCPKPYFREGFEVETMLHPQCPDAAKHMYCIRGSSDNVSAPGSEGRL